MDSENTQGYVDSGDTRIGGFREYKDMWTQGIQGYVDGEFHPVHSFLIKYMAICVLSQSHDFH